MGWPEMPTRPTRPQPILEWADPWPLKLGLRPGPTPGPDLPIIPIVIRDRRGKGRAIPPPLRVEATDSHSRFLCPPRRVPHLHMGRPTYGLFFLSYHYLYILLFYLFFSFCFFILFYFSVFLNLKIFGNLDIFKFETFFKIWTIF